MLKNSKELSLRVTVKFIPILFVIFSFQLIAQKPVSKTFSITAVGDIMMGTDFPQLNLPPNDGINLMRSVEEILKNADITFGNLESALLDGGEPEKECKDTSKCYIFRTPARYVKNLTNVGFNLMSLANNHAFDFGTDGYNSSKTVLSENNIRSAGKSNTFETWEIEGIQFGFAAFAPNKGCTSINDLEKVKREVKSLARKCDVVIVSFHGGAEGADHLHVKNEMEIFYGEKRGNVLEFAHACVDAGADLVIGHGPHVPRAVELYKDRFIAYSLGNFLTYRKFNLSNERGFAPILKINFNSEGVFIEGQIISARQYYPGGPVLDKKQNALKLIKRLTETDFPNTPILFNNDGTITKAE